MPETTRTFIAVAMPATLELKLSRLQQQLAGEVPEGRWEMSKPYHVTLAFLGDVDHSQLHEVCKAVAEASAVIERFELTLEGIGAFPNAARPRTVWAGLGGKGLETLKTLQEAVVEAVARLNYRPEDRAFQPHVTLGRFGHGRRPAHDVTPLLSHYKTWHAGPFAVTEAVIFGSSLTREGPIYAQLGRAPLMGRKDRTTT